MRKLSRLFLVVLLLSQCCNNLEGIRFKISKSLKLSPAIPTNLRLQTWNQPGAHHSDHHWNYASDAQRELSCPVCESNTSWEHCNAADMPCFSNTDRMYHQNLAKINPSVPNTERFQCVKLAFKNSTMNARFIAGCGYKDVDYCHGWNLESLELITCESCQFDCEKSYAKGLKLNLVGAILTMMMTLIL